MFVCIGHRDNVLARCDSIIPLLRCQGVWNKTCTQLSLSQILFQNPNNYSLGDVQRFCYHSWCDLTVIFDKISNSSNIYLSSSRFWTATSLVIFYQLPSVSKSRILPEKIDRSRASFPQAFYTSTSVSVTDRPALKQNFMATLCLFPLSITCKENWLYKTSYNSYTVEDKQTKLDVWTDVGW